MTDEATADPALARATWAPRALIGCGALVVAVGAIATRFVALDRAPAEWYGDVLTVYEVAVGLRHGDVPPGYYVVGLGVLYPMAVRPFLWIGGDSYLSIKAAGATWSLVGIGLLGLLGRQLLRPAFGLLAAAVGAVSLWWLTVSRLGDVQAMTPTVTVAVLCCTVAAVQRSDRIWPAVAAGSLAASGLYLYGNTVVLPLIPLATLIAAWRLGRVSLRSVRWMVGATVLVASPMVIAVVTSPERFRDGHAGHNTVTGWQSVPNAIEAAWRVLLGYATGGSGGFRAFPSGRPILDIVSCVATVAGIAYWLAPARRRRGAFLLASLVVLHVPVLLAPADQAPSVSRTAAAAPIVALFTASGIWWVANGMRTRVARGAGWTGVAVAVAVVVTIAAVSLRTYATDYLRGLPYDNVSISQAITDYTDQYPADVTVHLVGVGWEWDTPSFKAITYASRYPQRFRELDPTTYDCAAVAASPTNTIVIWDFADELPAPAIAPCIDALGQRQLVMRGTTPLFWVALIG